MAEILWQPTAERLGDRLTAELRSGRWSVAWFLSAWARVSGVLRLRPAVLDFRAAGQEIHAVVGIDLHGTTAEALQLLAMDYTTTRIFHNPGAASFHTKLYIFKGDVSALVFVGSNNLTGGGLYTNVETFAEMLFDLSIATDRAAFDGLMASVTVLVDPVQSPVKSVDTDLIAELLARGLVLAEAAAAPGPAAGSGGTHDPAHGLFAHVPVPPPPPMPSSPLTTDRATPAAPTPTTTEPLAVREGGGTVNTPPSTPSATSAAHSAFVMSLGKRDTQQQAGYSRDVYIPKVARDDDPSFWQWPSGFTRTAGTKGTYDERRVSVTLHAIGSAPVADKRRLFFYHEKTEFRFNAGSLIDGATPGDLIVFERATVGGAEYDVSLVEAGSPSYAAWLAVASNSVPSGKRWGYR